MKLTSVLTEYFCESNNIDVNANYRIEKIDASELITPERIDLIAKLKYIEYREKGYDLNYIKELYAAHIEAFSLGTYTEEGNDKKNSISKYFYIFDKLIDDIKKNGMDENISVIPVGRLNVILDGAHRTAIAAYYNFKVPIIRFNNLSADYGAEFFKRRLLDDKYLDYLVEQYCKYKQTNIYYACIWPDVKGEVQKIKMINLISKSCKIIYKKRIKLNHESLNNLETQIYSSRESIDNIENNFIIQGHKNYPRYGRGEILSTYVLECLSHDEILKLEAKIRDVFQIRNHNIQITDNHTEALKIARALLNKNSIDFFNNWFKRKKRYFKFYFKKDFCNMLKKIGIYEMAKKIYRLMNRVEVL